MKEAYEEFLNKHVSVKLFTGRIDGILKDVGDAHIFLDSEKFGKKIIIFSHIILMEEFRGDGYE